MNITISKNDSIKARVAEVIAGLLNHNTVFLEAKSAAIAKLVAVTELAKKAHAPSIHQYNRISLEKSLTNPNYLGERQLSDEQKALEEVRGPKVFQLPVLHVALCETEMELEGWSKQD